MKNDTDFGLLLQSLLQQHTLTPDPTLPSPVGFGQLTPSDQDMQELSFWQTQSFRTEDFYSEMDTAIPSSMNPLPNPSNALSGLFAPVPLQYDTPANALQQLTSRQGKNSGVMLKAPIPTPTDKVYTITDENILALMSKTLSKQAKGNSLKRPAPVESITSHEEEEEEEEQTEAVDKHLEKRRRNTLASARFRQKKKQKELELANFAQQEHNRANKLEHRVVELEKEIDVLKKLLLEKYPFQYNQMLDVMDRSVANDAAPGAPRQ